MPNNTLLEIVDHHLYLGIYLHYKLSWQPQVAYICGKANKMVLGFLWKTCKAPPVVCERSASRILCCLSSITVVLCVIWDPYHQKDIHKLEMVQHRAARFILNRPWHKNT